MTSTRSTAAAELKSSDRLLLCGDPGHWRTAGLVAKARLLGIPHWFVEPFCPRKALELIDQQDITVSDWYPWQLMEVLDLSMAQRAAYKGVNHRLAWVGGARIPSSLASELAPWWGSILEEYLSLPQWPDLADMELAVRDVNGAGCGPYQIGSLWAFACCEPETTSDTGSETELLGFADEQGQIFSLGKRANALSTAYGWLTPQECEVLLESHSAVAAAALVVIERDKAELLGYELEAEAGFFAVVVLKASESPGTPLIEVELLDYCAQQLSAAKCPFGLAFCDALPRASGGDVDRAALYTLIVAAH